MESFSAILWDLSRFNAGRGILNLRTKYHFAHHLIYTLLKGRPLIIYAAPNNEKYVFNVRDAQHNDSPMHTTQHTVQNTTQRTIHHSRCTPHHTHSQAGTHVCWWRRAQCLLLVTSLTKSSHGITNPSICLTWPTLNWWRYQKQSPYQNL